MDTDKIETEIDNKEIQYKTYALKEVEVNSDAREFTAIITNQELDRHKEVVLARGLNVKNFKNNGVILWQHNSNLPIGKAIDIKRVGDQWVLRGKIAAEGTMEIIDGVWQLIKQGILKAMSIGFIVNERRQPTKDDFKEFGKDVYRVISKSTLLEASVVSIPANSSALIQSIKDLKLDPKELIKDYEETIEEVVEKEIEKLDVEVNEEQKEQIVKAAKEEKVDFKEVIYYFKDEIKKQIRKSKGKLF